MKFVNAVLRQLESIAARAMPIEVQKGGRVGPDIVLLKVILRGRG